MTMLTRYNPVGEVLSLKQAMDRLFDDSFVSPAGWMTIAGGQIGPAIDMWETPDEIVVSAALPGLAPDDVEITLTGQTLSLRGEFKADDQVSRDQYVVHERRYGTFHRQLTLPVRVDGDDADATFEHGLLRLRIPKAAEVKPRQIEIQAPKQLT
jgi:HSP20 family protein